MTLTQLNFNTLSFKQYHASNANLLLQSFNELVTRGQYVVDFFLELLLAQLFVD